MNAYSLLIGLRFDITNRSAGSDFANAPGTNHISQNRFYRSRADIRKYFTDICFGQGRQTVQHGRFNPGFLGDFLSVYYGEPLIQFFVAHIKRRKEVLHKWEVIVLTVFPSGGGLLQGVIVVSLIAVDLFFKGHIFPYVVTAFVQQKQGKQPGHPAVAVPEGVDTKKVQNDAGDEKKALTEKNIRNQILVPARKDWNEDLLFLRKEDKK